jgi:hypothetical protein
LVSIIAKIVHRTDPHAAKYPFVFCFVLRPKEEEEEERGWDKMHDNIQYKTAQCRMVTMQARIKSLQKITYRYRYTVQ